ncbi:MAG: class I SAM-dependent methyltransferase [Aeromicrobium sp.]|uniref:methyltransferase domain-containing protein n=1 Tax=Aeromicrobium sp. TaxID=1871063 RepID=UPI0039E23F22
MTESTANEETLAAYEQSARSYADATQAGPGATTREAMRRLVAITAGQAVVLELGSGPGWDADALEELGPRVRRTDASPAFQALQAERGLAVDLLDALTGPYTDADHASYDAVMALCVLQHFERSAVGGVLREVAAALRPGGAFLVSIREGDGERWEGRESGGRYLTTFWTKDAFEERLSAVGLSTSWWARSHDDDQIWLTFLATKGAA